jgi:hypothetical protein
MESQKHCAFNQTRECFLGLHVTLADLSYVRLRDLLGSLTLKADEGLWVAPFRGIPTADLRVPIDLIYLDGECRVLDVVESFPLNSLSAVHPRVASLLMLPEQSAASSQTLPGDQLLICPAEEMQGSLNRLSDSGNSDGARQDALLQSKWQADEPLFAPAGEEKPAAKEPFPPTGAPETAAEEAGKSGYKRPKNWLERWLAPDPRRSDRRAASHLVAYYWNGSQPEARPVRDISETGLYLFTEERWYPGTVVLMTLQRTDCQEDDPDRAITIQTQAMRQGKDGVGMKFLLATYKDSRQGPGPLSEGVSKEELDRFLQVLNRS